MSHADTLCSSIEVQAQGLGDMTRCGHGREGKGIPLLDVIRLPGNEARVHESGGQQQANAGHCKNARNHNGRRGERVYEAPGECCMEQRCRAEMEMLSCMFA